MNLLELKEAIKKIKDNPENHGFSEKQKKEIIAFQDQLQKIFLPTYEKANQFITQFGNKFEESRRTSTELNNTISQHLKKLSKFGWYISEETPLEDIFNIAKASFRNSLVDDIMLNFYKKKSQEVILKLCEKYPARKKILKQAFSAHKKKMFFASTILFLSQADGLCKGKLFLIKENKKSLKNLIKENQTPEHLSILLATIQEKSTIDDYYSENSNNENELNRHGIMHGYNLNFGTEINSYKALSLLSFIGGFFERYKGFNV